MSPSSKCEQLRRDLPELKLVHDEKQVARSALNEIHQLSNEALFGGTIENSEMAQAARAGLILAAGGWDEAHRIVQDMDTPEAEYWHGIVHRREPDSSNAKYWFRQLGHHVVMDQLVKVVTQQYGTDSKEVKQIINGGHWDPSRFVDLSMACQDGKQKELLSMLLDIQQKEIAILLDYCIHQALAKSAPKY